MDTSLFLLLIAIFTGIIALSNLLLFGALAYLAVAIKRLLDTSVKPAIANVNSLVHTVENGAERIMDVSEDTVRKVSGRVVATTGLIEDSVASPVISFSSLLTGIRSALQTWRRVSARP